MKIKLILVFTLFLIAGITSCTRDELADFESVQTEDFNKDGDPPNEETGEKEIIEKPS